MHQAEAQRQMSKTANSDSEKTQKAYLDQLKVDSSVATSAVRRRWQDVEDSRNFDESSVHEELIQPVEKMKSTHFKNLN